jgi:hypothetical protein
MTTTVEVKDIRITQRVPQRGGGDFYSGVVTVELRGDYGDFTFDAKFEDMPSLDAACRKALHQVRAWTKEMAQAAENAAP